LANKILSIQNVQSTITKHKAENKTIVFTNGCFDVLHAGHVSYLQQSKALGDILVLGLNNDSSVKILKGEGRPVNNQNDRAFVLAGLASVDYIVIFDEETPYNLIQLVQPDVLTKGADYKDKEVVGQNIAKKLVLIDFIEGKSTSTVLDKIHKLQ
jgi:D-beta-D-heptose 7-phosphate kinase/D-beta-D-heptose 1-phosphate adenosyltransferase